MEKEPEIEVKKKASAPKKDFSNMSLNESLGESLITLTAGANPLEADKGLPAVNKNSENVIPKVDKVEEASKQPLKQTEAVKKTDLTEKKVRQGRRKKAVEVTDLNTQTGPGRPEGKTYETVTSGMSFEHARKLRGYVMNKKMDRDPFFTQRDALEHALDLLFEKNPKYVPK